MPSAFQRRPRSLAPTTEESVEASSSRNGASSSSSLVGTTASSAVSLPRSLSIPIYHHTLRPSPFPQQQPLPLFSLGLHAINDVLTGIGLPSGTLALYLPVQSTVQGQRGEEGEEQQRRMSEAGAAYADLALRYAAAQGLAAKQRLIVVGEEAEDWLVGLMGWSGAGIEDEERKTAGVAAGKEATSRGTFTYSASSDGARVKDDEDNEEGGADLSAAKDSKLKVAYRYEKLKRLEDRENLALTLGSKDSRTPSSGEQSLPYVHPFDLSTKLPSSILRDAKGKGRLVVHSLRDDGQEQNTYEVVWSIIQQQLKTWKRESEEQSEKKDTATDMPAETAQPALAAASPLPIRIVLPSLGSPAWTVPCGRSHAVESYRLLLRIKKLCRSSSWIGTTPQRTYQGDTNSMTSSPSSSSSMASNFEVPTICLCSPSASLLFASSENDEAAAATALRLSTLADSALAFSSFAADPVLRSIFQTDQTSSSDSSSVSASKSTIFTGALQILKTPSLGSLSPSSIRASQLRGLSSSAQGGTTGGGGSGGENALGFKVRRKGLKVEVLGRDLVADWGAGDDVTKKKQKERERQEGGGQRLPQTAMPVVPASREARNVTGSSKTLPVTTESGQGQDSSSVSHLDVNLKSWQSSNDGMDQQHSAAAAAAAAAAGATMSTSTPPPLKGLAALRARGLRAAASGTSPSPSPHIEIASPSPLTINSSRDPSTDRDLDSSGSSSSSRSSGSHLDADPKRIKEHPHPHPPTLTLAAQDW